MLTLSCHSSKLKVLVVDDHELTRLTLKLAFASQENIQVVGLASNGKEAVEMVQSHQPNVIVLDLQMPIMDGWTASGKIKQIAPETQIIAYSSVEDSKIREYDGKGNWDIFCKKDIPTKELVAIVRQLGTEVGSHSVG
ncbi:response regulator transcription factor [Calothrix sp. PCC 6303]|uniref:response regulator n=1 Tax=Calothrix sp. PCC 6303 TaxID=1170562 RepID=UPI0002A02690|nr:response regulator transcription factor [Calothrix sp. PCC 6303]AFZ03975.1 response regulator receiver protein [Calothrix sp. PCC 6303]